MKKLTILIILIGLLAAAENFSRIEKKINTEHYNVSVEQYNQLYKNLAKTIVKNNIYIVTRQKNKDQAFYYGCGPTGHEKINIDLIYNKDKKLITSYNVLVEGDYTPTKSAAVAEALSASLNTTIAEILH